MPGGDPVPPEEAPSSAPSWEPAGLIAGALALIAWGPVLGAIRTPEAAAYVLSAGLAGGVLAWASLVLRSAKLAPGDGVIAALIGFLGWPVLLRRGFGLLAIRPPPELTAGMLLEGLSVAIGLGLLWVFARSRARAPDGVSDAARLTGAVGWGGTLAGLTAVLLAAGPPEPGAWLVLALAAVVILAALALQRGLSLRSSKPQFTAFASAPALVLAGSQLLDGVVSYLAVNDPLGVLAGRFQEEVLLSAALLEAIGPGYPIAKWGIALVFVYYMDAIDAPPGPSIWRLGTYLLVALLGLVPGLFSTTQLAA